jgi:hypothetical protein
MQSIYFLHILFGFNLLSVEDCVPELHRICGLVEFIHGYRIRDGLKKVTS